MPAGDDVALSLVTAEHVSREHVRGDIAKEKGATGMTTYHVAVTGDDRAEGSEVAPLRTIDRAAQIARPGDTVLVHAGEYREWVKPARGGMSDRRRITYCAAPGEHVVIKGSERVDTWQREEGTVWSARVPNSLFGQWNPFAEVVEGDWVVRPGSASPARHLGDVYLGGRSFYEVGTRAEVDRPAVRQTVIDDWTGREVAVPDADATRYVWYAEVGREETTIWANFNRANPNSELVEINVRRSVFYPERNHCDFITVRGFELAQAASPWAPPTGDQPGLIGPNWAKGWIIEDNVIHDAKCVAVSIGKEITTGDNYFTRRRDKPGYQYQLESVFTAERNGWRKESIGSHLIRRNRIFDCGQAGIVGHLGCVFSRIEDNDISSIATKREFFGHEIAGIKLHAAIDVQIEHNHIHDCSLGIWLDWQTQGTRITRNVLHENARDLFVEVSHGPYIVDHNILASEVSVETMSDGGAYVRNLLGGTTRVQSVMNRATPYHLPHSTLVAGYAVIYGGDDRWIGNIFIGRPDTVEGVRQAYPRGLWGEPTVGYGTAVYDDYPPSLEDYLAQVEAGLPGDLDVFLGLKNPVTIKQNVYLNGAAAYQDETDRVVDGADPDFALTRGEGGSLSMTVVLPDSYASSVAGIVRSEDLGRVRMVDAEYEGPDGKPAFLAADLTGQNDSAASGAGPVSGLVAGLNTVRVW